MEQSKEIKQNLAGLKNFDICICALFGYYNQSLTSPANFDTFPNIS